MPCAFVCTQHQPADTPFGPPHRAWLTASVGADWKRSRSHQEAATDVRQVAHPRYRPSRSPLLSHRPAAGRAPCAAASPSTRTRPGHPCHPWLPALRPGAWNCISAVSVIVPQTSTHPCPCHAVIAPPADWAGARRRRRSVMITNQPTPAQAVALAHQFCLKVEAEFTLQTVQCQADQPVPRHLPGDPRPRDDETSPGRCRCIA